MAKFKTIEQVWEAVEAGQVIYWVNKSYQVIAELDSVPHENLYSQKNGRMLRVTCMSNWFGSRITPNCLDSLFVEEA